MEGKLWGSVIALASMVIFFVVIGIDRARFMPALILFLMCWNIKWKEAQLAG